MKIAFSSHGAVVAALSVLDHDANVRFVAFPEGGDPLKFGDTDPAVDQSVPSISADLDGEQIEVVAVRLLFRSLSQRLLPPPLGQRQSARSQQGPVEVVRKRSAMHRQSREGMSEWHRGPLTERNVVRFGRTH